VDTEEQAQQTIDACGIDFTVEYGADYQAVSSLTGCFYEEQRKILHSTGYVIRPDGTVAVGEYTAPVRLAVSSGRTCSIWYSFIKREPKGNSGSALRPS
jgi:hypothetical protein